MLIDRLYLRFPGETEEDFMATLDLIHAIGCDHSFSFVYSPRPGTPAAKLHDGVDMASKKHRLKILQDRIKLQGAAISQAMVGTTQAVLVTGHAKKHAQQLSGRTENNRVVNFAGDTTLIGKIVSMRITESLPNSLRGVLI